MMGYSLKSSGCFMNVVAYPLFAATLAKNPEALALANNLDPSAGEYMRPALETVEQLIRHGCFDLAECDKIEDNYSKVILRFFEGDVPMMICTGDTVSGTKKRESQSEAFTNAPFAYSFLPIPLTDEGGYFIDSPSLEFSVNKDCDNLDMTNEFMRFLITNNELNEMASVKRLVTPTTDLSFDSVYAPFGQVPSDRTFSPEVLGIKDPLTVQIRVAAYRVGIEEITVDEAIAMYGSFS
jgi:multiple sugar transport system substrate-binding protein